MEGWSWQAALKIGSSPVLYVLEGIYAGQGVVTMVHSGALPLGYSAVWTACPWYFAVDFLFRWPG